MIGDEERKEEQYIAGKVLSIFFQNSTNFYKVLLIKVTETNQIAYDEEEIVVTGHFGQIQEEMTYQFFGHLTNHPKYGLQFQTSHYQEQKPKSEMALLEYFSSDKFPGIGKVTAQKVIDTLGERAIEKIERDPDCLKEVPGLNRKKIQTILSVIDEEEGTNKILFFLQENGLSASFAYKIIEKYQERAMELLKENPYRLIEDIENIGFVRADHFAENLGISADSPNRLKAALYYALQEISLSNGDTYAEKEMVVSKAMDVLERSRAFLIEKQQLEDLLEEMVSEERIKEESNAYFLPSLYYAEKELALIVEYMIHREDNEEENEKEDLQLTQKIKKLEKKLSMKYGETQKEAIKWAVKSPLFILTGGPGTGKTTVIEGIVELFAELNDWNLDEMDVNDESFPILLTAPTGRAAKRMNESTGLPSATIHRLLGLNGNDEEDRENFGRELKGKLLIVDEMSMVDTWLANQLFHSIPDEMHVILVGDKDQLPSVGPGQVFSDLIESGKIPTVELQEIYRQEDGSSIIPLAHHVKNGQLPDDFRVNQRDRSFFNGNSHQVLEIISTIVGKAIEKGFSAQDIQVLAPMYRGPSGVDILNKHLQDLFNPNDTGRRKEVKFGDTVYRIGDKILQLVNDTETGIFNGDIGEITGITFAKDSPDKVDELTLLFDQKEVVYKRNNWNKITLAYCTTIHKAQGSEFNMVILPMVSYYGRMLRKDLLYTAITRASERLILCGELEAFERCVHSGTVRRKTMLRERITALLDTHESVKLVQEATSEGEIPSQETKKVEKKPQEDYVLTAEKINNGEVSPMIGMDTLTPYTVFD